MKKKAINLFGEANDKTSTHSKKILQLRAEARNYRDENNQLVAKLWDINLKLEQIKDEKEKEMLIKAKSDLTSQIKNNDYDHKFTQLLEEIKTLELNLYGHSDVGGNSPFVL